MKEEVEKVVAVIERDKMVRNQDLIRLVTAEFLRCICGPKAAMTGNVFVN